MDLWQRTDLEALKTARTRLTYLFLDDGDVLNDNRVRAGEWRRLIGEFMPPRMGGTAEQWESANRVVFPQVWPSLLARLSDFASHHAFQRTYAMDWMTAMCDAVGVTRLPDDRAVELHTELSVYVNARANSAIAGAADAVHALHRAGYTLYTASGTTSWELRAILEHMGIADLFSGIYGPDLVDHVKHGSIFYRKMFEDAGVAPSQALVIDSDATCCRWASEVGANAVWIDADGRGDATTLEKLAQALV
ncbi:MAG: HAD family hydrolase [Nitrolancea sp.]